MKIMKIACASLLIYANMNAPVFAQKSQNWSMQSTDKLCKSSKMDASGRVRLDVVRYAFQDNFGITVSNPIYRDSGVSLENEMVLRFDDNYRTEVRVDGAMHSSMLIIGSIAISDNQRFSNLMARSNNLKVYFNDDMILNIGLHGSSAMLDGLEACVNKIK